MSTGMIIALAVIAILMAVGMMVFLLSNSKREQQKRIFAVIAGQSHGIPESERDGKDRRRADLAKKLQQQGKHQKKSNSIRDQLNKAGFYETPVSKFWFFSVISGVVFTSLATMASQPLLVIFLISVIGFFGFPRLVLKMKISRRQKRFLNDFSDALESMVRLLKAGMPVSEAIAMMSREYSGPVGEEMLKIYEQQKIGIPLSEACIKAAERMPITEMQMFATGISIQQQTGSSLSEVLLNLAKVIRARFRLKRKIQALSAEAKASAMIIGSLPILVCGGLYAVNPEYMFPLFHTLKGKYYLGGAVGWMCMGIVIMRQMINFRI
ncbi:MAG: type II secretion protein F [Micavibrio aeruginosavorus]|uniref:Type II secretion protein F n=1 Tax=Micavibrio aeruginosavorus TaxID=349221 RepID=A0A2W5HIN9_9BACT|nr:MAG: type II secretion protein F [Micavibrio aeruginosavorus]